MGVKGGGVEIFPKLLQKKRKEVWWLRKAAYICTPNCESNVLISIAGRFKTGKKKTKKHCKSLAVRKARNTFALPLKKGSRAQRDVLEKKMIKKLKNFQIL